MSRLASFRGPSTPTSSPIQQANQRPNKGKSVLDSPSRQIESTYHRKVRTCLQEIRAVTETWEDLVILDGLKSLKKLVDTRTDLEYALELTLFATQTYSLVCKRFSNQLAHVPNRLPRAHIVAPKLQITDQCIGNLDAVIGKLVNRCNGFSSNWCPNCYIVFPSKNNFGK
jgi:hypothetical protein